MRVDWILYIHQLLFTTYVRTRRDITKGITKCDAAAGFLYSWCEQSACTHGCRCKNNSKICKQICSGRSCSLLKCTSTKSCRQSALVTEKDKRPFINRMIATSVDVQQDCSQANCRALYTKRYPNMKSKSLQICPLRNCDKIVSHSDISEQLASNTEVMRCSGIHAKNCTQHCVFGHCKHMICKARYCKQSCSHNSRCFMSCGKETEICDQTCNSQSNCHMKCTAKNCHQKCADDSNNCTIIRHEPTISPKTSTRRYASKIKDYNVIQKSVTLTEEENKKHSVFTNITIIEIMESKNHISNSRSKGTTIRISKGLIASLFVYFWFFNNT